jgi:hypothetical protein
MQSQDMFKKASKSVSRSPHSLSSPPSTYLAMNKNTKVDPYHPKQADVGDMQMEYSWK